mmetsp:Transcript_43254/g.74674  ORF Transcript_43254/g.74674 Transcript_43254/m.74674 type:complete len:250 (+) Transcript_43254:850-1599(+)
MRPRKCSCPSLRKAWPAMGVLQLPSSVSRKARSQSTAVLVSAWFRAARYLWALSSFSRHWMPMAPWATAGSISSNSSTLVATSSMSMRLRPARASRVASTTPSSSLRSRVCTFPRKFTTLSVGFLASSCACRRSEAEPITLPSGSSWTLLYFSQMNASRVSSLGRLQGRMVVSGSQVGTSFIEWTQMSTSLFRRATSSSLVKRPFPPISDRALSRIISPWVFMTQISIAPSWSSSPGKAAISRLRVSYA